LLINLTTIDWNTISAISTFLAVLVALFYPQFQKRIKLRIITSLCTRIENGEAFIHITVINLSERSIWLTAAGIINITNKIKIVKLIGDKELPREIAPSEPFVFEHNFIDSNFDMIRNVYVADSSNKFHYLTRKGEKILKEQLSICMETNDGENRKQLNLVKRPKLNRKKI